MQWRTNFYSQQLIKHLADFTDFYRGKKKEKTEDDIPKTVPERLAYYIIEGTKEGLIPDLEAAFKL